MFITFFTELRAAKVPVTLKEYLTLMEALEADVAGRTAEDFYYLARASPRERRAPPRSLRPGLRPRLQGPRLTAEALEAETARIPEEWLRRISELYLTDEEKAKIQVPRRLGEDHGGTRQAPRRAEGAPPGRQ